MARAKKKVSIYDIAEKADVSIATVSRVLSGKENVVPETSAKVLDAARKLNYPIKSLGKEEERSNCILVSIPSFVVQIYDQFIHGLYAAIKQYNFIPVIMYSFKDAATEREFYNTAIEKRFSGAVLVSPKTTAEDISYLSKHMSVVQCFDYVKIPNSLIVRIDDEQSAFDATTYLINKGHKRIGLLQSNEYTSSSAERRLGYLRALGTAGIPVDESIIFKSPYEFSINKDAILNALKSYKKMDAIFCTGSDMAYRIIFEANNLGIKIPDELSVMGFDDVILPDCFSPSPTIISQDTYSIGYFSIITIGSLLKSPDSCGITSNIEYKIIERNSVADRT